ncbi:DUF5682 family protein [Cohnella rhizosphaerae]|uniref:DUF5682 family protein n=1 Tax=Cohnella rhizosphaerae TaxID=1457232 RepID=UPI0030B8BB31
MNGAREPHFFGIRHLSPAGSYHLLALLDEVRPTAVLIEGPSDAGALASQLVARGVVPPVALLAYTVQLPVRTLLYPFAEYSPEYQALRWAERNGSQAEFIDLPTGVSLALNALRHERSAEGDPLQATDEGGGIESSSTAHTADGMPNEPEAGAAQKDFYARVAERSGEPDFESYWERNFEHRLRHGAYRQSISRFSEEMRAWTAGEERRRAPHEAAYNEIREAYMRRKISDTLVGGHDPGRVVVLTGAYHTSALAASLPAMTDDELALLPRVPTKMTLMPYSYYKLSSHSGYGAGNAAPAYFELMWRCMRQRELDRLQALYLSSVAARLREGGHVPFDGFGHRRRAAGRRAVLDA